MKKNHNVDNIIMSISVESAESQEIYFLHKGGY